MQKWKFKALNKTTFVQFLPVAKCVGKIKYRTSTKYLLYALFTNFALMFLVSMKLGLDVRTWYVCS